MKKVLNLIICVLFIGLFVIQPYYVNAETDLIIYVDGINGNDESGTGLNPSSAVKTLEKAYELLQTGGSIYIVNTVSINEEMTITDTQYKDENKTINLHDNAKIKEIKRYVQPTSYGTLTGYNVETNKNFLINVDSNVNLTIDNITIDGHFNEVKNNSDKLNAMGITNVKALITSKGILNLKNVVLQNNHSNENGGAVFNSGEIFISDGEIKNNYANFGAALYSFGIKTEIVNCDIHNNNTVKSGGAIISGNETFITNSKIYNNNASAGGAIYVQSNVKIFNTDIYKNVSTGSGGAIFTNTDAVLEISNSNIYENEAKKFGGALYTNGEITLLGTNIYANKAIDGGAMTAAVNAMIKNCKIYNNEVTGIGGAIEAYGNYEVIDSHIYSNTAKDGGGIWNYGTLTLKNTIIENNIASNNGNGIYQSGNVNFDENVKVDNNDIFLCDNKKINIISPISKNSLYVITPNKYELGQVIVSVSETMQELAQDILSNIKLTPKDKYIERPGDLNISEAISDKDIIISKVTNTIIYSKKSSSEENIPTPTYVYWQEEVELSDIIPEYKGYSFLGWKDENDEIISEEKLIELLNNTDEDIIIFAHYEPSNEIENPNTFDESSSVILNLIISLIGLCATMICFQIINKERAS